MPRPLLLSRKQAAEFLGISVALLDKLVWQDNLARQYGKPLKWNIPMPRKLGRRVLFSAKALEEWANQRDEDPNAQEISWSA